MRIRRKLELPPSNVSHYNIINAAAQFFPVHFCLLTTLSSVLLRVQTFPPITTAGNIACVKASLMEEWGIANKVTCTVTDVVSCVREEPKLRHHICVAHTHTHTLNVIVKKHLTCSIRAPAAALEMGEQTSSGHSGRCCTLYGENNAQRTSTRLPPLMMSREVIYYFTFQINYSFENTQ